MKPRVADAGKPTTTCATPADMLVIDRGRQERCSTCMASSGPRPSPGRWGRRSNTVRSRSRSPCRTRAPCRRPRFRNDNTAQMLQQADEVEQDHRQHGAHVRDHEEESSRPPPTTWSLRRTTSWTPPTSCGTTSPTSTTSSDLFTATSTGTNTCFDIPRLLVASLDLRCSRRDRCAHRPIAGHDGEGLDHLDQVDAAKFLATLLPPTIESMKTMRDFMVATHSTMAGNPGPPAGTGTGLDADGQITSTRPKKTTTPSTCRRKCSRTPTSNAACRCFVSLDGKAVRLIITPPR